MSAKRADRGGQMCVIPSTRTKLAAAAVLSLALFTGGCAGTSLGDPSTGKMDDPKTVPQMVERCVWHQAATEQMVDRAKCECQMPIMARYMDSDGWRKAYIDWNVEAYQGRKQFSQAQTAMMGIELKARCGG